MERNPLIVSNTEISDLPPEVLEIIFNETDLATKKKLRLVCKSWQEIIDTRIFDFRIRNMRTPAQLKAFLDSSVKEFRLVTMEFTWGMKFPKYLLKDGHNFNTPKIKELVFAKPSYRVRTPHSNTSGGSQVLQFFINFLKSGCHEVEHLNIHSRIMDNFIVSDLERALASCTPWNTVQKLSLPVSPIVSCEERRSEIRFAPMKTLLMANIPHLNYIKFELRPTWLGESRSVEIRSSDVISVVVDMCKFLLRYKKTLKHVFLRFSFIHYISDWEKHLSFMEEQGPFDLESFSLEVDNAKLDDLGYIATACTQGTAKLRTFGYSSNKYTLKSIPMALSNNRIERLERILLENGSTIEDLTLDMTMDNLNLFRHCPNLKTLKFGEVEGMNFQGSSSKFPNITRLKVQNNYCTEPQFVNWVLEHCPSLTFFEIGDHWNASERFLEVQSILLEFDKLKEILLFVYPHNYTLVEIHSSRAFKCVRKIHPSTSVPYLSILVKKHNP